MSGYRAMAARSMATAKSSYEFELPVPFNTHDCESPAMKVQATKDELMHYYREMVVIRRMETAADGMYKAKLIRGFCHLCTGQVWAKSIFSGILLIKIST